MSLFYKGVGAGTFLGNQDLRISGLSPRVPGAAPSYNSRLRHISTGTTLSCYISLTRSYGIAESYAWSGVVPPTRAKPGYVYEIDIDKHLLSTLTLIDPVCDVADHNTDPAGHHTYHHTGDPNYLLAVIAPRRFGHLLLAPAPVPPGGTPPSAAPALTRDLTTIVRALRDAEILVQGNLPAACFVGRHDIY